MVDQDRKDQHNANTSAHQQKPRAQSDPDSVVKKGGIAKSDAEVADVTRDTHGFPADDGGLGATSPPPDLRGGDAGRVNAQINEALEAARQERPGGEGGQAEQAEGGAGQPEGERTSGRNRVTRDKNLDEAEAPGE